MKILTGEQMYREVAQSKTKLEDLKGNQTNNVSKFMKQSEIESNSNYHRLVEMQEIFFNCSITANPQVHFVHWLFNGKSLNTDLRKGKFCFALIFACCCNKYNFISLGQFAFSKIKHKKETILIKLEKTFSKDEWP